MVKFPSNICNKILAKNHKAICCDLCDICVDTICNKINVATYNMSQNNETKLYCIEYSKENFPFSSLNKVELFSTTQRKNKVFQKLNLLMKKN